MCLNAPLLNISNQRPIQDLAVGRDDLQCSELSRLPRWEFVFSTADRKPSTAGYKASHFAYC